MKPDSKIYVAGGKTLVGRALLEELEGRGYRNLIGRPGEEPDLTDPARVEAFFAWAAPEYVFLAAGRSGGIQANRKYPAELMRENLLAQTHVIHEACRRKVRKLLYLASSCSYPRDCPQPMREDDLLTGPLEPTNEAYALAKIAGLKLCEAYRRQHGAPFISAIPANVFGPGDDFSEEDSHVIPGLIRRMHAAKEKGDLSLAVWGSGRARREFVFSRDLADACVRVMEEYQDGRPINLGTGIDFSVAELAGLIREVVGFSGRLSFDARRPDGMPVKILDSRKLAGLNWKPRTPFRAALEETYRWFREAQDQEPRPRDRSRGSRAKDNPQAGTSATRTGC